MEEERFGGKYSEQQASERGRSAHRLTYRLSSSRHNGLSARGSLAKLPILPTKRRPRWVNATVLAAAAAEYNS